VGTEEGKMKKRMCPKCKKECGSDWITCPHCGGRLVSIREETKTTSPKVEKPQPPAKEPEPTKEQIIESVHEDLLTLDCIVMDTFAEDYSEVEQYFKFIKESKILTQEEIDTLEDGLKTLLEMVKASEITELRRFICRYIQRIQDRIIPDGE
jgi:hypothetical protein